MGWVALPSWSCYVCRPPRRTPPCLHSHPHAHKAGHISVSELLSALRHFQQGSGPSSRRIGRQKHREEEGAQRHCGVEGASARSVLGLNGRKDGGPGPSGLVFEGPVVLGTYFMRRVFPSRDKAVAPAAARKDGPVPLE